MKHIRIRGKQFFDGSIDISGSKNASLPIIAASLLINKPIILQKIPNISDVKNMIAILKSFGTEVVFNSKKSELKIEKQKIEDTKISEKLAKKIRASSLFIGPILAMKRCVIFPIHPGGCKIGSRPLNIHLECLKKMGANVKEENDKYIITTNKELNGINYRFPIISVGATSNVIMAAVKAKGNTILNNVAIEPEVIDLINFLKKANFKIEINEQKRTISIFSSQKTSLQSNEDFIKHSVIPDRIEAATYIIGTAISGKKIKLINACTAHIRYILNFLEQIDAIKTEITDKHLIIEKTQKSIKPFNIKTSPYPGFPTDIQALITVLATQANGMSTIKETIFEDRFKHVHEIQKMNGKIIIKEDTIYVYGKQNLQSCSNVFCSDLRAGYAMILAAIQSKGTSLIKNIHHIERGYENIISKLSGCNVKAEITQESE
ncbi:UDP-N-acetylglucosamine 1-carboxyvinyltransferase [Anaplasmataceae bacterium AB001_6]|nr:UDP-N-acetylglucosamine 1-carboxyvinyltransferase [Anaplasmataceae bacterium AB001_6]